MRDPPKQFLKGTALATTARICRLAKILTCFQNLETPDFKIEISSLFPKDQNSSKREIFQKCIHLR